MDLVHTPFDVAARTAIFQSNALHRPGRSRLGRHIGPTDRHRPYLNDALQGKRGVVLAFNRPTTLRLTRKRMPPTAMPVSLTGSPPIRLAQPRPACARSSALVGARKARNRQPRHCCCDCRRAQTRDACRHRGTGLGRSQLELIHRVHR